MWQKAFSMLEILFSIIIISLIGSLAFTKYNSFNQEAIITKIRTDLTYIRSHIAKYENKKILLQEEFDLFSLDDGLINTENQFLFSKILNNTIQIISNKDQIGSWIKTNTTTYEIKINENTHIAFEYLYTTKRFDCDMKNEWCVRLNQ